MIVVRRVVRHLVRIVVYVVAAILIAIGVGLTVLETGWAKNRIRDLIVRQANEYLTATLSIGRLEGSILRGIPVGDVLLSRAADLGADLLVIGAYGHSRVRELLIGGATRSILQSMTLPVLMSH